jgi:hypothetical protein
MQQRLAVPASQPCAADDGSQHYSQPDSGVAARSAHNDAKYDRSVDFSFVADLAVVCFAMVAPLVYHCHSARSSAVSKVAVVR